MSRRMRWRACGVALACGFVLSACADETPSFTFVPMGSSGRATRSRGDASPVDDLAPSSPFQSGNAGASDASTTFTEEVCFDRAIYLLDSNMLYRFDPTGADIEPIGAITCLGVGEIPSDLAVSDTGRAWFVVRRNGEPGGRLHALDLETGSCTPLGLDRFASIDTVAVGRGAGQLLAVARLDGEHLSAITFARIDTNTGTVEPIAGFADEETSLQLDGHARLFALHRSPVLRFAEHMPGTGMEIASADFAHLATPTRDGFALALYDGDLFFFATVAGAESTETLRYTGNDMPNFIGTVARRMLAAAAPPCATIAPASL